MQLLEIVSLAHSVSEEGRHFECAIRSAMYFGLRPAFSFT
jgi:hypothetical protein